MSAGHHEEPRQPRPRPVGGAARRGRLGRRAATRRPGDGRHRRQRGAVSAESCGVTPLKRLALIGNSLPRRCGIATFTTDLQGAIATARPDLHTCVVAMNDAGQAYDYPPAVGCQIREDEPRDYRRAADFLNAGGFDVISLQHEFGIFGGEAGKHILPLLSRLTAPVVSTLHTVLADP